MPRGAPLLTRWYDGISPRAHAVFVRLDGDTLVIEPREPGLAPQHRVGAAPAVGLDALQQIVVTQPQGDAELRQDMAAATAHQRQVFQAQQPGFVVHGFDGHGHPSISSSGRQA